MLSIMLSNSGKCNPYHSRNLELSPLAILSISSNEFIAWIIWRSGLSETSVTFDDDNPIANSLNLDNAAGILSANPESTIIWGFVAWIFSNSASSIICASMELFFNNVINDSSLTVTPLWSGLR